MKGSDFNRVAMRRLSRLCFDRIFQPAQRCAIDCNHIETARRWIFMALQVNLRSENQPRLLRSSDAGGGATVTIVGAFSDFDKYKYRLIMHDQIDFAALATKIALDQRQTIVPEIVKRIVFADLTVNLSGGTRSDQ